MTRRYDEPIRLQPAQVIPMTPDEEARAMALLGRLIADRIRRTRIASGCVPARSATGDTTRVMTQQQ